MNIKVEPYTIEIEKLNQINSGEYNIAEVNFEFSNEYEGLTKQAVFSTCTETYKTPILNNKCTIPYEVLQEAGNVLLGVYGYESVDNELELRYSPTPKYFNVVQGSYREGSEPEIPPRSEWEELVEEINTAITETNNLNIEADKEDGTTTITITHKDGTEQTVEILDGEKGDKGDKGDPGAIKMIIVASLPQTGQDDTIYLVPLENPTEEGNNYAEYVYINGQWELLGKIGVHVDLTDYVKFTDYATSSKGGVVKAGNNAITVDSSGNLRGVDLTYAQYTSAGNIVIIDKGTLENVITGKGLVSNTSYASESVAGVIKPSSNYGLQVSSSSGVMLGVSKTNAQFEQALDGLVISKGTLNNVLTERIGNIQTLLDTLNNGGGVS